MRPASSPRTFPETPALTHRHGGGATLRGAVVLVTCGLLAACAAPSRHAYAPASTTSAVTAGRPTASVPLPFGAPTGEMQLTSIGIGRVVPPSELGLAEFRALYVRMTIHNRGREPWTVDQGVQTIELMEAGSRVRTRATTPTGARPHVVTVAPGQSATIDLAFPVGVQASRDPPEIELQWTVQIGAQTSRGTLTFTRRDEAANAITTPPPPSPEPPPPYDVPGRYPTIPTE